MIAIVLAGFLVLPPLSAQGIQRCVDADGHVSFTDEPCPGLGGPANIDPNANVVPPETRRAEPAPRGSRPSGNQDDALQRQRSRAGRMLERAARAERASERYREPHRSRPYREKARILRRSASLVSQSNQVSDAGMEAIERANAAAREGTRYRERARQRQAVQGVDAAHRTAARHFGL